MTIREGWNIDGLSNRDFHFLVFLTDWSVVRITADEFLFMILKQETGWAQAYNEML